jgi:hypothetical protein
MHQPWAATQIAEEVIDAMFEADRGCDSDLIAIVFFRCLKLFSRARPQ